MSSPDTAAARRKLRAWSRWVYWIAGMHLRRLFRRRVQMRKNDHHAPRRNSRPLGLWHRRRLPREVQSRLFRGQAQGPRLPLHGEFYHHGLLHRRARSACYPLKERAGDRETNHHNSESRFDRIKRFAVEGLDHGRRPRGLTGKHDQSSSGPDAMKMNPIG